MLTQYNAMDATNMVLLSHEALKIPTYYSFARIHNIKRLISNPI